MWLSALIFSSVAVFLGGVNLAFLLAGKEIYQRHESHKKGEWWV
jgi:hypothetical protein